MCRRSLETIFESLSRSQRKHLRDTDQRRIHRFFIASDFLQRGECNGVVDHPGHFIYPALNESFYRRNPKAAGKHTVCTGWASAALHMTQYADPGIELTESLFYLAGNLVCA